MPPISKYPFKLESAFFTSITCKRAPEIPSQFETKFKAFIKVGQPDPPMVQVFIKLETDSDDQPVTFDIELVGVYSLLPEQPMPESKIIESFVNEQSLYGLWPYAVQMIYHLTGQMGTNPIRLPTPIGFEVHLEP